MLCVERDRFEEMVRHAEAEYPHECCGILVGRREGGSRAARRVFPAKNVAAERLRDRFEMDAKGILDADRWARENGAEVVGFYHSHPDHPPIASATDNDRARPGWHDGYSFLILAVARGKYAEAKSWVLDGERLVEEELEILLPAARVANLPGVRAANSNEERKQ